MESVRKGICTAALLALSAVLYTGCGASDKLAEKTVEKVIETATGAKVETSKDNQVTITTKEGQVSLGGDSGKVPDGFPLQVYPGAKIESSITSSEQGAKNYIVSLSSDKPANDIAVFYAKELAQKGMTPEKTDASSETGTIIVLNGKTEKADATIQIADGDSIGEKGFVINLFYSEKQ